MLPKSNRLPAHEISHLLRSGKRIRGEGLEFVYKKQKMDSGPASPERKRGESGSGMTNTSRFAFIASTKIDKRATARNRMKRLVREAVRRQLPRLKSGVDGVLVVRRRIPDTQDKIYAIVLNMFINASLLNTES